MFYKLSKFVFVRNVNNYMLIVDKRNDSELIGDYTSYLFVKHLEYQPLHIDVIVNGICTEFGGDVDYEVLKNDAVAFFDRLSEFGFVQKKINSNDFIDEYIHTVAPRVLLPESELEKFTALRKSNPLLQNISVAITQKCNERCVHCYIPHENKNVAMSDSDFYHIVDMCYKMQSIVNFRVTGGECMSHPSFKKFIKYVKEKGFALSVLTNLTLLDDEIVDILKQGTLSNIQISMFSTNPEIHDKITMMSDSLDKTLKNIEKLENASIPFSIATQAMELNKNEIEDLHKFAQKHKCNLRCDWTIIAKENHNNDNLSYRISDLANYKNICKTRLKYLDGYKEELRKELLREPKADTTHLCNAGTNGLYIDTNLKVHPCPGWDLTVGDLKTESLSDIWHKSKVLQKVRDVVLKDFPKCAKCDIRNLCSICMAQADLENTANNFKFEMPEYVCNMYKVIYDTIKEEVLNA
ncbi:MAG: radical SAM protein [Alphaproteobacteria bacterium]|nr:radical SAM protein [Alphaproteobacteria bacterium]